MHDSSMSRSQIPPASRLRLVRLLLVLFFLGGCGLWFVSRVLVDTNLLASTNSVAANSALLWATVSGDLLIALAYFVISATLLRVVRLAGRELPYHRLFLVFALFIFACGVTHLFAVVTIWHPMLWLAAVAKVLTAVASVGTAAMLFAAADDMIAMIRTARHIASQRGQERFRALFMATPLAVISFDLEGLVTFWNPSAEKLFGFVQREVLGKPNPIVPTEFLAEHSMLLKSTLDGSVTKSYETIRQRQDGSKFPVCVSSAPLFSENGRQVGIMAVIEDISERKRMETEIRDKSDTLVMVTHALNTFLDSGDWKRASRELLTFAVKQTHSQYGFLGVVLDDSRLRILAHEGIAWSETNDRNFYDQPEHGYRSDYFPELPQLPGLFSEVVRGKQTIIANHPRSDPRSDRLPPGHPPLNAFLGVPIFKGNQIVGLIGVANRQGGYSGEEWRSLETMSRASGILFDDYRQHLARRAIEQKHAALEAHVRQSQNMELLARVAGGVSHDFNNMLMIVSGCAEMLERSLGPDSLCQTYLEQMQSSTARAAVITRQLLAFSRKQVLDIRELDLHAVLAESQSMLSRLLGPEIELAIHCAAVQSWILSEPSQIVQVMANLASNSRDAMPNGGRMEFITRNTEIPPVSASTTASEIPDWLVLEVRDTGSGMDKETLARIFEPFFTNKPTGSGSGLGLSTVYGVIRQSGGYIFVHSEPGAGTCFEIYFPAVSAPQQFVPAAVATRAKNRSESATVLLVDDEASLVHAIGEFLRESGFIVLDSVSPEDALQIASEHPGRIDILLTDVVMPGLRGPDLHRLILAVQPEIQVLFMSGYAEGLPEMQLPRGASFLQKPFRFSALLETLKELQSSN